jgi:hypothetical protein
MVSPFLHPPIFNYYRKDTERRRKKIDDMILKRGNVVYIAGNPRPKKQILSGSSSNTNILVQKRDMASSREDQDLKSREYQRRMEERELCYVYLSHHREFKKLPLQEIHRLMRTLAERNGEILRDASEKKKSKEKRTSSPTPAVEDFNDNSPQGERGMDEIFISKTSHHLQEQRSWTVDGKGNEVMEADKTKCWLDNRVYAEYVYDMMKKKRPRYVITRSQFLVVMESHQFNGPDDLLFLNRIFSSYDPLVRDRLDVDDFCRDLFQYRESLR